MIGRFLCWIGFQGAPSFGNHISNGCPFYSAKFIIAGFSIGLILSGIGAFCLAAGFERRRYIIFGFGLLSTGWGLGLCVGAVLLVVQCVENGGLTYSDHFRSKVELLDFFGVLEIAILAVGSTFDPHLPRTFRK